MESRNSTRTIRVLPPGTDVRNVYADRTKSTRQP